MTNIVLQLYSARDYQPWADVVERVAALGYTGVEGFGPVYEDPAAFRATLDRSGLTMPTGHFALDQLEVDFPTAARIAATLGIRTIICPWLSPDARPTDRAGWIAVSERLAAIGDKATAAGFRFGWHNHDFEFTPVEDGTIPQDLIMQTAPDIGWEADLGWIVRAGQDPVSWVEKYGDRILAVHLKDVAPAGTAQDEDGWADFGHGVNDWAPAMAALAARPQIDTFVAEHDHPNNFDRFAGRWIEAFRSLGPTSRTPLQS